MRRFNPEKELNKIKNGNKKKVIMSICALLVVGVLGYSFALYQVHHTQKLVFNTVGEFKKRDIYLSVLVDGETKSDFPGKNDGYVFDNIICDKPGIEASFNNETWKLTLTTGTTNKCTVKFITKPYMDDSGANYPDLFQGLIPIRFDEQNKMYIADYKEKWYDYNQHEWANAVLIDHNNPEIMKKFYTDGELNVGTEITADDVLQMYVWIPRYKYQLWNAVSGANSNPQMINIKFENAIETTGEAKCSIGNDGKETCTNVENGNWYTHPAFTFGDTELRGIWIGKFELSDSNDEIGTRLNKIEDITILPGKTSMINKNISIAFFATRNIELEKSNKYNVSTKEIDTHLIKNSEWGAVAYFSSSKYGRYIDRDNCISSGCEVWINNSIQGVSKEEAGGTYTGCVGNSTSDTTLQYNSEANTPAKCAEGNRWNEKGVNASTTGNIYGIYDMSGGEFDITMGVIVDDSRMNVNYSKSGFDDSDSLDSKYYNLYDFSDNPLSHDIGHLGDATRETSSNFGRNPAGWNNDYTEYPHLNASWFGRGGEAKSGSLSGLYSVGYSPGIANNRMAFHSVLTAQDGID